MSRTVPLLIVLPILTVCSGRGRPGFTPATRPAGSTKAVTDEAEPVARVPKLARAERFGRGWCANSIEPDPNAIPEPIRSRIERACEYLKSEKLLPPEWELCAFEDPDDGWSVLCRPLGGYAFSSITVVLSDGEVKGYYYSDFSDGLPRDEDTGFARPGRISPKPRQGITRPGDRPGPLKVPE